MATSHLEAAVQQQAIDAPQALLGGGRVRVPGACGRVAALQGARQGRGGAGDGARPAVPRPGDALAQAGAAAGPGQPVRIATVSEYGVAREAVYSLGRRALRPPSSMRAAGVADEGGRRRARARPTAAC